MMVRRMMKVKDMMRGIRRVVTKMIGLFVLLLLIGAPHNVSFAESNLPTEHQEPSQIIKVQRIIDGDTFVLSNGEKIRLIGIDTPESRPNPKLYRDVKRTGQDINAIIAMGKEATKFTRQLLEGKRVNLKFDISPRDRYGRLLAYAYLEDGTFVNAEIIKAGYAQVMTVPPNVKYQELFLKLQKEAREKQKGLWK